MKKIVTVIGARPQFIKAGALSPALKGRFKEVVVHTGQHGSPEMSGRFFGELSLAEPKYHLGISDLPHGAMTGRMLEKIEELLLEEKPDALLVFGDTNSTAAGALAAAKLAIPVAHVEAGLRSHRPAMAEEINRKITDHLSSFLYCPSEKAKENLLREGIPEPSISVVGDIIVDAAQYFLGSAEPPKFPSKKYILATLHRAENVDSLPRLRELLNGLGEVAEKTPVVLPLHPRTRKNIEKFSLKVPEKIHLLPPQGYKEMLSLQKHALLVATDSGGVQKEAYFCETPCLVLREETEWTELVERGYSRLLGATPLSEAIAGMKDPSQWEKNLYGDGHAARRIAEHLDDHL